MSVAANQVIPMPAGAPEQKALKDFWEVYDANYDQIAAGTLAALADQPEFGPILKAMLPEQMEANNQRSRGLMRRAILEGEWDPYFGDLREQGALYARGGLSFTAWFEAIGAFTTLLGPLLLAAYGKTPRRMIATIDAMNRFLGRAMAVIGEAYLGTKEQIIREQQEALRELSTPVLQVRERMLLLPIVGMIDTQRARQLTEGLLHAIRANRARVVVIDITGVAAVDSKVANHLVQTVDAARLMGTRAIVTGLSAEVAQALVTLGVNLSMLNTVGDLQGGLEEAERLLGYRVVAMQEARAEG